MKLYERIKFLLGASSDYRNSDRKLIWRIWKDEFLTNSPYGQAESITLEAFMKATSPETVRRTRQKVQAEHPALQSDKQVLEAKKRIQDTKGTFVYREEFTGKLFNN